MQLPLLRQMKRLLRFLGLGIGTTLLILVLNLISIPSNAQQILSDRNPPDFAPPLFQGSRDLALSTQSNLPAQASQSTSSALDLVQQGKTNYQKGQLEQAVTLWQQAADAFAAEGDRLHQAMTLSYLAQAYQQLGIWDKANPAIAQSLQLLKQPIQGATGERLHILAEAQTIQGSLQLDQGQASDAFASWQLAANAFQQAGDRVGVLRSQINQSQALVTLGLYKRANNLLGSLYEKLPSAEEPLQLAILLNYGESLGLIGRLQADQSAKPQTSQQSQNSAAVLEEGLKLAQKLQSPVDITKAQISLGNTYRAIYQQQKRLQPNPCPQPEVLAYRSQALEYYRRAAQDTDSPISKIQALSNQQSLLLATQSDDEPINADNTQQTQQVLAIAAQIQGQLDRLPLSRIGLYAQIQLAYNLLRLDQMPSKLKDSKASNQAAQLLEVAVKQARTLRDRTGESYALGYLGQAYAQQQQSNDALKLTNQALSLTTKALNLAKTINAPEIAYRWFWQLGRLERTNNPEQAIKNYNEAYNTLQLLRTDLAFDNTDIKFSFEEHPVERAYREFADLLLQPKIAGAKELQETKEADDANLQKAREVMRSLQVTELQNFLQQPCAEASLQQIDKITDEPDSHTATLSPIIFRDRIEVIVRLPGKNLFHYRTDLPEATAKATIAQFQRDLQESYTFDTIKENGQKIYKWLIEPAQKQLESAQIKTIVFVLDGPFRNIPMTALYDGEHYLIEKYAVSVALGLDLSNPHPLPKDGLKVLAASLTDPPNQREDKFKFAKLSYVKEELDAIKNATGVTATLIQDEKFTRNLFNQKFNDSPFQIVHLATHGQFSSNPEDTFILTASSNSTKDSSFLSDGKVRLKDFDAMFRTRELNRADAIELLILSACETASGDDRATLGIAGTAVKAGARSAIASLWSLDDESSQTFIKNFYKAITKTQTSRAEALRQAQLALLQAQDGPYTHPRYWAPFLLIGNWL
ncbi:MAG: CHAT domain-containing protein [Nostoc sp. DedQUE08]|uniref:CHAT domain-containing protein n=1 Tax=Nostoc sp. DedQUE08 TaxID=3075393 RepID=UPI002AD59A93|nr:CHAT domain-containing protein [Nostoc sp. DedQUE08]MDZ8066890.1 CHAT domain-containing protein [Nostoc sp. DedQUE08]